MQRRPICVALAIVIASILFFYPRLLGEEKPKYDGEKKELLCQLESVSGVGADRVLTVTDATEEGELFAGRIRVYNASRENIFSDVQIGNILSIYGEIYSFSEPGNPGQFNEEKYYRETGTDYKFFAQSLTVENKKKKRTEQFLQELREKFYGILQECLPEREAGIVAAMVLGEKCGLSEETRELYQENGIAHLLAISGLHISILGAGLFFLLRRFVMPMKLAALCSGTLLVLYGMLTGFPVSTRRAVLMMLCMLAARFVGKRYDRLCALALSALIQMIIEPLSLFQTGFLLSYGTVLGISIFLDDFTGEKKKGGSAVFEECRDSFLHSLGISLVTCPILLASYYEVSCYSVVANVLVLPWMGALLVLSLAGGILGFLIPYAGSFLFGTVHCILRYYEWVCRFFEMLPGHRLVVGSPGMRRVMVYYLLMALFLIVQKKRGLWDDGKRRIIVYGIWLSAILILFFPKTAGHELQITNLDVGQGDCSVIRAEGMVILIDGGSSDVSQVGKYRISKYLKYCGIGEIDYIFITHSDSDHVSGLLEILEDGDHMGFDIGAVVIPDIEKRDENYEELSGVVRQSGVPLKKMKTGDVLQAGGLVLQCLHPTRDYLWQSENDYSLVLQLEYGGFRGLFTGDLEEAGETAIEGLLEDVDYLKVGHHGSKGSSSQVFLDKLRPETAVISAGKGNRYGHPTKEALGRLTSAGAKIYSTIDSGAVMVTVGKDGYEVEKFKDGS